MSDVQDLRDGLDKMTGQLEALLVVASSEAVDSLSSPLKDNYLWACSDLATKIRSDFSKYCTSQKRTEWVKNE